MNVIPDPRSWCVFTGTGLWTHHSQIACYGYGALHIGHGGKQCCCPGFTLLLSGFHFVLKMQVSELERRRNSNIATIARVRDALMSSVSWGH